MSEVELYFYTDVDFRHLVNRLPKGASFTILPDSCHSGGLIDKGKEQIPTSVLDTESKKSLSSRPKTIPFLSILQHFSSLTNINTSDIATHLLALFGSNSSLKFRLPLTDDLDFPDFLKPNDGILLCGCQVNETSADLNSLVTGRKACGAFSNAVQAVLKENPGKLSNREVVMMIRKVLKDQGIVDQHPCLYCSDENADAVFLRQQ